MKTWEKSGYTFSCLVLVALNDAKNAKKVLYIDRLILPIMCWQEAGTLTTKNLKLMIQNLEIYILVL